MQPIYYRNCTSNHCFDIPMVLILSMVWQYLAFFCWIFTWTSSHVLGLMTNTMLAILYLQSHAVLLWCIQGASYVFYISILNIRLSCERYRKNIVKNTVLSGYQVNLPYRGTLPSHSALTQQLLSQLHKAIYIQGLLFIHFDCDISRPCVLYPFCVLHPKPITYTVQIWFMWIPRCDFYSRVQICGG